MKEKPHHTNKIAVLLTQGKRIEAVELHDAHVRIELEKAKQGTTINLRPHGREGHPRRVS